MSPDPQSFVRGWLCQTNNYNYSNNLKVKSTIMLTTYQLLVYKVELLLQNLHDGSERKFHGGYDRR